MAVPKKFHLFFCILAAFFIFFSGNKTFAKSKPIMIDKEPVRESVTGTVTETALSDHMIFLHIVPSTGGDDVWVAVPDTVTVADNTEYTFEGTVFKNYRVKILKRKFSTLIFSSGPQ